MFFEKLKLIYCKSFILNYGIFQMRMASSVFASWPSSFSAGIVQYWNCEYIGEYYDCPCLSLFVYMTLCHLSSLIFSRFSNFDT